MPQPQVLGGRYALAKKLGRRPLGEAFAARDSQLERPVVLETIQGPPLNAPEARLPASVGPSLKADLERLAQLQSPHLINLLDLQFGGRPPFLVFEPLEGEPLMAWLGKQRLQGEALEEVLEKLTRDLLAGLGELHAAGVVHKDVRPASVFRTSSGDFVLMEPGLPRSPELLGVLHPSMLAQTTPFLAPEVLRGEPATPAGDMVGLGAVLRFVATGRPLWPTPEKAETAARSAQAPPPMAELVPGLREAWRIFLDELVAPDPAQRIASVAAANEFQDMMMMEEAAAEAGLVPGGAAPGTGLPPPPDPERVSKVRPLIPAVLVVLLLAAGYAFMPGTRPPPALTTHARPGVEDLLMAWSTQDDGRLKPPLKILIEGEEPQELQAEGAGPRPPVPLAQLRDQAEGAAAGSPATYWIRLPWKAVAGKAYRIQDAAGQDLAADELPTGYHPYRAQTRTSYLPDGSIQLEVEANRELTLEASWTRGGKPVTGGGGEAARRHVLVLKPGFQEAIEGIALAAKGPLGEPLEVEAPAGFPAHEPFFKAVLKKLRGLVPKPIKDSLKAFIKEAAERAVTRELTGWDGVEKAWREDPELRRLRAHAAMLFSAHEALGDDWLHVGYEAFLELERVNTALVALTPHDPLPIRPVYAAYCRAFTPEQALGKTALAPGTGPIMMQYDGAPPSWLNEDGAKDWPYKFETPFALKPDFYADPATKVRFSIQVEDVSPLYRIELFLKFRTGEGEVERSFWFYPRRNMQALAAKKVPAETVMALELPVRVIPQEIGKLVLTVDKLGYWGGHGGTTFHELKLEKVLPGS